jgi:hypothetical protein
MSSQILVEVTASHQHSEASQEGPSHATYLASEICPKRACQIMRLNSDSEDSDYSPLILPVKIRDSRFGAVKRGVPAAPWKVSCAPSFAAVHRHVSEARGRAS